MRVRLLIVDDEKEMVDMLRMFMKPICSLIDDTDNLSSAVKMAAENKYNLVILDLRLRVTGKKEALHVIRTLKSYNTAVIVVSGVVDPHIKEEIMAAGADGYVAKDGDSLSRSLLLAANIAVLHLPRTSFKSDSFTQHVAMLQQMVQSAA